MTTTRTNSSLASLASTPLQTKKPAFQLTYKIRSTQTVKEADELDLGIFHGLGVLQKRDLDNAVSMFTHHHFVKFHFNENRLTKWLNKDMHVFQIHHESEGFTRVHGTIVTDEDGNLVAYCVENNVTRQIKVNKDKMLAAIKQICRFESYAGKL